MKSKKSKKNLLIVLFFILASFSQITQARFASAGFTAGLLKGFNGFTGSGNLGIISLDRREVNTGLFERLDCTRSDRNQFFRPLEYFRAEPSLGETGRLEIISFQRCLLRGGKTPFFSVEREALQSLFSRLKSRPKV